MKPNEDPSPAEVQVYRRALDALPRSHRAMVRRLARVMLLALDAPPPARRVRLAKIEPAAVEPDEDQLDELARAEARRILAAHGRRDGAA